VSRFLFLLRELVARDLRSRYAGSTFGFVWAFVYPAWQLLLYNLVFAVILRIPLVGERTTSFAAFLFAGLLPWLAFQEGVARGAVAIAENAHMVKKLRFPSQVLVVSVVLAALVHAGIALALFAAVQAYRGELVLLAFGWLAAGLVGQVALTLGLALAVAALQVYMRDVAHGLGLVLSALFYATPIVYPVGLLDNQVLRTVIVANPMTTVVTLYRSVLVAGEPPALASVAILWTVGAVALALGVAIFHRLAPGFADEL
jgi:ABC-type polysaccharide/polyol phosphate export permease